MLARWVIPCSIVLGDTQVRLPLAQTEESNVIYQTVSVCPLIVHIAHTDVTQTIAQILSTDCAKHIL